MDIAITGASGLVGTALGVALERDGHTVRRLRRPQDWDPDAGTIDGGVLDGCDAVVQLAGVSIGDRRWTPEQKRAIRESRTRGTTLVANALAALDRKPSVLVSGSAVGWYGGVRGDETLTEDSPPPQPPDFLADVCREWEAATAPAEDAGIRVVHLRTGIVLTPRGGVLKRMLLPFRLGLGGRTASGRQYMSWIALEDEVGAIRHAIDHDEMHGPMNATAPNPVTNAEFARALGHAVHRPAVLPTPRLPLELVYGKELVQHLLVEGQRVLPARLQATGYAFRHTELGEALRSLLG
jgi:uncharacterized protein (TIGR01777 family)